MVGVRRGALGLACAAAAAAAAAGGARAAGGALEAFEGCGERMQANQGMILAALGPCVAAEGASEICCGAMADTFGHANAATGGCLCYEGVVEGVLAQASMFMPGADELVTDVVATCSSDFGKAIPFVFPDDHGHKDPAGANKGLCSGIEDPSATRQGTVPTHEVDPNHPSQVTPVPEPEPVVQPEPGPVVKPEPEPAPAPVPEPRVTVKEPPVTTAPSSTAHAEHAVHDEVTGLAAQDQVAELHSAHPAGKLSVEECGANLDANRASLISALGPCIASNGASDMCCSALEATFGAANAETGGCLCYGSLVRAILAEARAFVPQAETMLPEALAMCGTEYGVQVPWSLESGPGEGACKGYVDVPQEDLGRVHGSQAVDVIAEQSVNLFSILTVEACSTNLNSERAAMAQALQPCMLSMGASEKCCDALEEAFGKENEAFGYCMCHPEVLDGVVAEAAVFLPTAAQVIPAIMEGCVSGFDAHFSFAGQQGGHTRCPGEQQETKSSDVVEVRQVDASVDLASGSASVEGPGGKLDVSLDSGSGFVQKAAMAVVGGGILLLSAFL